MAAMKTIRTVPLILFSAIAVCFAAVCIAADWGTVLYTRSETVIREKRTVKSRIKGRLKENQAVRADFFKDHWYAVFPVNARQRNEKKALGYVYKERLTSEKPESAAAESDIKKKQEPAQEQADLKPAPTKRKPALDEPKRVPMDQRPKALKPIPTPTGPTPEASAPSPATADMKTAPDEPKPAVSDQKPAIAVKSLRFKARDNGRDSIFIEFNRFYAPSISSIEGDKPRIVLDLENVTSFQVEKNLIKVDGVHIRQIRSHMDRKTRKARIVLDLEPLKDYYVQPEFAQKENLYSLHVLAEDKKKEP